jgi:hypothetical protein
MSCPRTGNRGRPTRPLAAVRPLTPSWQRPCHWSGPGKVNRAPYHLSPQKRTHQRAHNLLTLVREARRALGVEIPMYQFFEAPAVAELTVTVVGVRAPLVGRELVEEGGV